MEHGPVGISSPAFSVGGVSTEYMIVGQEVLVAEVLGGLSVVSDHFRVGTYLSLGESHAYLHAQPPSKDYSRIHPQRSNSPRESHLDANDPLRAFQAI
jgi:hypothetical protein